MIQRPLLLQLKHWSEQSAHAQTVLGEKQFLCYAVLVNRGLWEQAR